MVASEDTCEHIIVVVHVLVTHAPLVLQLKRHISDHSAALESPRKREATHILVPHMSCLLPARVAMLPVVELASKQHHRENHAVGLEGLGMQSTR